jgi:hypothetical protein
MNCYATKFFLPVVGVLAQYFIIITIHLFMLYHVLSCPNSVSLKCSLLFSNLSPKIVALQFTEQTYEYEDITENVNYFKCMAKEMQQV